MKISNEELAELVDFQKQTNAISAQLEIRKLKFFIRSKTEGNPDDYMMCVDIASGEITFKEITARPFLKTTGEE